MSRMPSIDQFIITTPRLLLRPWKRSDLEAMADWPPFTDPLDAEWNWPRILQERGTLNLFWTSRNIDPQRMEWTICLRNTTIIGYLSIRNIDHDTGSAWLGIGFGSPYIGQGYGSEALGHFLDHYFGMLKFRFMQLDVALYNARARRLYQQLGFQEARTFWHQPELPLDWKFLDDPRYASIRHLFRHGRDETYVQCLHMILSAQDWRRRMSDPD